MSYSCKVEDGALRFFKGSEQISSSPAEIFELAQSVKFGGDRSVSAFAAKLGLQITARLPDARLSLIAKADSGNDWFTVFEGASWIDTGTSLSFIDGDQVMEIREALAGLGLELGPIKYQDSALLVAELGDSFHFEFKLETASDSALDSANFAIDRQVLLTVPLHPYQEWSVSRITQLCTAGIGAVLADEMGLGKTIQSIAVIANIVSGGGRVLVVVPPVLIPNWRREFRKFAPGLRVGLLHRASGETLHPSEYDLFDVVLTAYSTVAGERGDLQLLNSKKWDLVVVDEAQFIKNPDAKRSKSVKDLRRSSSLALSGTPVENSPLDIWSISEFIFPSLLGSRDHFDTRQDVTSEALDRVRSLLLPLLIRRTLDDISDKHGLPDRIDEAEYLEFPRDKRQVQDEILTLGGSPRTRFNELVLLAADANIDESPDSMLSSPKFQRLRMIISNAFASDEKVIVFCTYRTTLDNLLYLLRRELRGAFVEMIRGDSGSPEDRQKIVDEFSSATEGVLLLNPQAAGYGLNITSANNVVHYHPLWNPALTDQATKRAHRPGQTRITRVHHLLYESSVEEVIYERSNLKREVAKLLIGEDFHPEKMEDLSQILERLKSMQIED